VSGQAIQKGSSRKGVGGGGEVDGTRSSMMTDTLPSKMVNMALDINGKLMIARDTDDVYTGHTEPHIEWKLILVLISTFGNWHRCCLHSSRGCWLIGDTKRRFTSSRM